MDFAEARDSEWQWHQLGHMQVCTWLQTDNHSSTTPLSFLQAGCPTNSVKALKAAKLVTALLNYCEGNCGPGGKKWQRTAGFMTHVTCRLTAKNRDQLRNPTIDLVTPLMCVCVRVCVCVLGCRAGCYSQVTGLAWAYPKSCSSLLTASLIMRRRRGPRRSRRAAKASASSPSVHSALHCTAELTSSRAQSVLVSPMPRRVAPLPLEGQKDIFERTTILLRPFNGLFSRTTWVSRYQKCKTSLDLNERK